MPNIKGVGEDIWNSNEKCGNANNTCFKKYESGKNNQNFEKFMVVLSASDGYHDGFSKKNIKAYFPNDIEINYDEEMNHLSEDKGVWSLLGKYDEESPNNREDEIKPGHSFNLFKKRYAYSSFKVNLTEGNNGLTRCLKKMNVNNKFIYLVNDVQINLFDMINKEDSEDPEKYKYINLFGRNNIIDPATSPVPKKESTNHFYIPFIQGNWLMVDPANNNYSLDENRMKNSAKRERNQN
jgi:hypothetical protein